jgi:PAS domain S-box-containing protein
MNKPDRSKGELIPKWGTLVSRIKGLVSYESGKKQVVESQPESDALLRYLVGISSDVFYLLDAEGCFVDISQGACDSLGYTREELLQLSLWDIIADSDHKKTARILEQAASGGSVMWQVIQRSKDGALFPAEFRVGKSDSRDGKLLIAVSRTPAGSVQSESSVQGDLQLLETILEHTHMLIAYMDPKFNFVRVNRAYAEADERDPSFFPGKNHFDLYPNEENKRIFQRVVETGEPFFANAKPFEYAEHPERGVTYWDWSLVPIDDTRGRVQGLLLTLADVTDRMLSTQSLRLLQRRLNERVKELSCLYGITKLIEKDDISLDEVFRGTVDLIIAAWKYPEITTARLQYKGREFKTEDFEETIWKQTQDLRVHGEVVGNIQVCYLEERPISDEGPFLKEESSLLYAIAKQLEVIIEHKLVDETLRENEERLRSLFQTMTEGVVLVDPEGHILQSNPAAERILGLTRSESEASYYDAPELSILHSDGTPMALTEMAVSRAMKEQRPITGVVMGVRSPDGGIAWINSSARPLINAAGGIEGVVGTFMDFTERMQTEKQIELEIARTETLMRIAARLNAPLTLDAVLKAVCEETSRGLDGLPVMILLLDEEANLLEPVAAYGLPKEFHHDYRPVSARVFGDYRTTKDTLVVLADVQVEAGSHSASFYMHYGIQSAVKAFLIREKELIGMLNVYSFEAGRKFSEEELALIRGIADQAAQAIENARLREKSKRVAVIEERSRLARDLHDSVAQALYGVTLNAQAGERMYAVGDIDQAADQLKKISKSSQEALRDMRLLIYELRPADLEEGLSVALQARLDRVEKRSGLETLLKVELKGRLNRDLEEGLYRIAQEALNNVLKHAQANRVEILLGEENGSVFMEIVDDGVGFNVEDLEVEGGLGISGMQERAAHIGGKLSFDSRPGQGTRVKVEIDLRQDVRGLIVSN